MENQEKLKYQEQKVEHFFDASWVDIVPEEKLDRLVMAKTKDGGAYMSFYFDPKIISHGYKKWHTAYTEQYVDFCKMFHEKGLTMEDFETIKNAVYPSNLAKREIQELSY